MQVISSGTNTQLHSFPDLTTVCIYPHYGNKRTDFQCKPDQNSFLAVNPSIPGFEIIRLKNGAVVFSRCKKVLMNDVKCGAFSGPVRNEVAIGYEDGTIRFFDLKKSQLADLRFKAGKLG